MVYSMHRVERWARDPGLTFRMLLVLVGLSLLYVLGAELDFVDDLSGAYFKVSNPNASSSCGCGSSFSV